VAQEAGCASTLFPPDGDTPVETLVLGKRLALAATDAKLFGRWRDFVGLPLHQ
jgi:hypothetical protein